MRRALTIIALASAAGGAGPAWAGGDTHYQDSLLGERAAGMGGAFTALGNEATGALYNPAGIVVDGSTLIQLSMSAYKLRAKRVSVTDFCGRSLDADESGFFGLPGAVGFVRLLQTGSVRHAIGVTLAVPFAERASHAVVVDDVDCAGTRVDLGISAVSVDRAFTGGLTYAVQPWPWLRAGMTFGLSLRDVNGTELTATLLPGTPGARPAVSLVDLDVAFWSAFVQFGLIVDPPGGLSFGLSLTTPYFRLSGNGRLDVAFSGLDPAQWSGAQLLVIEDAEYNWRVPLRLALGAAYVRPQRFALALDVSFHPPVGSYALVEPHPGLPFEVNAALPRLERRTVVNVNAGGELYVHPAVVLRGGAFTNFSSQPELDLAGNDDERLHYVGVSLGTSYLLESSSLSLVVVGQLGLGETVLNRVTGTGLPDQPFAETTERADVHDLSLVIALGGNYDLR